MEKKKQKRLAIKAEQGKVFDSHKVLTPDLHSSLLPSLRVPLGKERKFCSGDDLNICNSIGGEVPNLEQTLSFHRKTCLLSFKQANQ